MKTFMSNVPVLLLALTTGDDKPSVPPSGLADISYVGIPICKHNTATEAVYNLFITWSS